MVLTSHGNLKFKRRDAHISKLEELGRTLGTVTVLIILLGSFIAVFSITRNPISKTSPVFPNALTQFFITLIWDLFFFQIIKIWFQLIYLKGIHNGKPIKENVMKTLKFGIERYLLRYSMIFQLKNMKDNE